MGIIVQQDGAFREFTHRAENQLNAVQREIIELPAYSLRLSECNFHIHRPLKKALKSTSDDGVQKAVIQ
jgi:hypothetical protein